MRMTLCFIIAMAMASVTAYAAEGERLGQDDFISSTLSNVFDKIGQYTSGEKGLLTSDDEDMDVGVGHSRDALGRKVPASTLRSGRSLPVDEPI